MCEPQEACKDGGHWQRHPASLPAHQAPLSVASSEPSCGSAPKEPLPLPGRRRYASLTHTSSQGRQALRVHPKLTEPVHYSEVLWRGRASPAQAGSET